MPVADDVATTPLVARALLCLRDYAGVDYSMIRPVLVANRFPTRSQRPTRFVGHKLSIFDKEHLTNQFTEVGRSGGASPESEGQGRKESNIGSPLRKVSQKSCCW